MKKRVILAFLLLDSCQHKDTESESKASNDSLQPSQSNSLDSDPQNKKKPQRKDVSCQFFEHEQLSSCIQIIQAKETELKSLENSCKDGLINQSLCPLENSLGQCVVTNGSSQEHFLHYKSNKIPQQLEKVKNNCAHNSGIWKDLDLDAQLLSEMKEAYIKRFDELKETGEKATENVQLSDKDFHSIYHLIEKHIRLSLNAFKVWMLGNEKQNGEWALLESKFIEFRKKHQNLTQEKALNDPNWFNSNKILAHRFMDDLDGGCGTLSSFLCVKYSHVKDLSLEEVSKFYNNKGGTSTLEHFKFFQDKGLCTLGSFDIEGNSCKSYIDMQKWRAQGCQIEVGMHDRTTAHVEFVYDIVYSKTLNFCYGITNSWGSPAVISGGASTFYHELFDNYNNSMKIYYNTICPCSAELVNSDILKKTLNFNLLVLSKSYRILETFLKSGSDINIEDTNEMTLLQSAMLLDEIEMIKMLIHAKADLNKIDKFGYTPLTSSIQSSKIEIVKMLIDAGADLNKVDSYENSPLIKALLINNIQTVRLLVNAGANIKQANKYGMTPLFFTKVNNNLEIQELLKKAGAKD